MKQTRITVALAGNPNSGKTTLFNALTGARQHIGNYPGVTVEKKEGLRFYNGFEIKFVDLPGTYSLTAYSIEEIIARDVLVAEPPDLVVHVVDSSNLERNLYLTTQLMEMNTTLVLAFNMIDVARRQGHDMDLPKLSELLGCPIVPTVASRKKGIDRLLDTIIQTARHKADRPARPPLRYGKEIEQQLESIMRLIPDGHPLAEPYGRRWLALKLLEQDREILDRGWPEPMIQAVAQSVERIKKHVGDEPEIVIADRRYGVISGACQEAFRPSVESRHTASDAADAVLLHRLLGLPIFALLMYAVFALTFRLGDPLMGWIETAFEGLATATAGLWPPDAESPVKSLLVDGILGGVGGVVVFLPNILLLFLAIAIIEDSGYMARAAFLMDRVMHKIGLHGKSFIPMLIGFGCSIPAMMGTRILEDRRNRLTTLMIIPLMSCGARLPIYALLIPAFFAPCWHGLMMWLIYMIGIGLAIVCAWLLRKTLLRGQTVPFVMELPPYRVPTLRGVLLHMWQRGGLYLKKAGTVILAISIVLWAMTSYPKVGDEALAGLSEEQAGQVALRHSIAGRVGSALGPVLRPMGFDERIGTALIGALAAKEVFVAQLGIVYSMGQTDEESETLREKLRQDYTPLQGFCIMLFALISAPCIATVAVCRRESGTWTWALFQFAGLTALAYGITAVVYQVGRLLL